MSDLLFEMQSPLLICAKGDKNRLVDGVEISLRVDSLFISFSLNILFYLNILFLLKFLKILYLKSMVHYSKMNIIKVIKSYDKYNVETYNLILQFF